MMYAFRFASIRNFNARTISDRTRLRVPYSASLTGPGGEANVSLSNASRSAESRLALPLRADTGARTIWNRTCAWRDRILITLPQIIRGLMI